MSALGWPPSVSFHWPPRPRLPVPSSAPAGTAHRLVSIPRLGATVSKGPGTHPHSDDYEWQDTNSRHRHTAEVKSQPEPGLMETISSYLRHKIMRETLFQFSYQGELDELLKVVQLRGCLDRSPGQVYLLQTPCF